VLVNHNDGNRCSEKVARHQAPGRVHRAFFVFLFKIDGSLRLRQRAVTKYHFACRWSNSCCGHPGPGQDLIMEAQRRTHEELRLTCELSLPSSIIYRVTDPGSGFAEHEFDYILVGLTEGHPVASLDEASDVSYQHPSLVMHRIQRTPQRYTPWLPLADLPVT
jgi:isopentenyl-diphosphate delta-isomerase